MFGEQLCAEHAARVTAQVAQGVVVGPQGGQAGAGGAEQHHDTERDPAGVSSDPGADGRPQAGLLTWLSAVGRDARPERPAADDEEEGGQEGGLGEQGGHDGHGTDGTETVQGRRLGGEQAEHRAGDRGGRSDQGRQAATHRRGHGVLGGGVTSQLFAVAVREEQGVVAGGTEHQHDEDRRRQRADGEPSTGETVSGGLGDDDRAERAEKGEQPQDRAAVDEQEDDRHDDQRGEQQASLGAAAAIGGDCSVARHRDLQAVGRGRGRRVDHPADGLHGVGVHAGHAVLGGGHGHRERHSLTVGRPLQRTGNGQPAEPAGEPLHPRSGRGDRGQIA